MKVYCKCRRWWYMNFDGYSFPVNPKRLIKKSYLGEENGIEVYDAIIDKDRKIGRKK